jgi:hypothetical protein
MRSSSILIFLEDKRIQEIVELTRLSEKVRGFTYFMQLERSQRMFLCRWYLHKFPYFEGLNVQNLPIRILCIADAIFISCVFFSLSNLFCYFI